MLRRVSGRDYSGHVRPVRVAQVEHALDRVAPARRRLVRLDATDGMATVEVTSACRVSMVAYRVAWNRANTGSRWTHGR